MFIFLTLSFNSTNWFSTRHPEKWQEFLAMSGIISAKDAIMYHNYVFCVPDWMPDWNRHWDVNRCSCREWPSQSGECYRASGGIAILWWKTRTRRSTPHDLLPFVFVAEEWLDWLYFLQIKFSWKPPKKPKIPIFKWVTTNNSCLYSCYHYKDKNVRAKKIASMLE